MAWKIETNGTKTEVKPGNGKRFKLKEMQTIIGGYVERYPILREVPDWPYVIAWFDEDGLPKRLKTNRQASQIAGFPLVGTVLFCTPQESME